MEITSSGTKKTQKKVKTQPNNTGKVTYAGRQGAIRWYRMQEKKNIKPSCGKSKMEFIFVRQRREKDSVSFSLAREEEEEQLTERKNFL